MEYANLTGYLANSGATTIASALYTGTAALNGFSYDGATGGFYAIGASSSATPGDLLQWASLADVLTNTNTVSVASYNGNIFNFYDPDATVLPAALSTGSYTAGDLFPAQYYQSAGNGRLEGFESAALYAASPNNRTQVTGTDAFGGATTAFGAGVDAVAAFAVPEPGQGLLAALGLLALLGRRR